MTKKAQNGQALEMVFQKYDVMSNDDINLKKEILDILKQDKNSDTETNSHKKDINGKYLLLSLVAIAVGFVFFFSVLLLIKFGFNIDPNILKLSTIFFTASLINIFLAYFYCMGFLIEIIGLALGLTLLVVKFSLPDSLSSSLKEIIPLLQLITSGLISIVSFSVMGSKLLTQPTSKK
ncbi:hypothetical protein [Alistipes sp. ZOR0009]|uniref:hypothetical protein n=1 Tax=Alistipes sp. ZOR0009 TaxID=1339253 RepID=UPI0006471897|nr:hypothetical protein [Alistipes sp. ZOR0009]